MSSTFDIDVPDNVDAGGGFLDEPGQYLLLVNEIDTNLADGFKVHVEALDGTVRDAAGSFTEEGKSTGLMFFNPKMTQKNNGEFNRKKQARFLIAVGLLDETKTGQRVSINLEDARNRMFVAKLQKTDDGKYLEIAFTDIFHVDDPAVAKVPKAAKWLAMLPAEFRRKPESFAKAKPASGGKNGGQSQSSGPVDTSDL